MTCLIIVELLQDLSTDLWSDNEPLQASVSYIFIFLLDVERDISGSLPAPVLHKVNCGVIKLLSKAEKISVQTNALGKMYFMLFGCLLKSAGGFYPDKLSVSKAWTSKNDFELWNQFDMTS